MKKFLFTLFFLFGIHLHLDSNEKITVVLYRGVDTSVVLNVSQISFPVSFGASLDLQGSGSNEMSLGSVEFVIHSNSSNIPHTVELSSSTYDSDSGYYVALNGTRKLRLRIDKFFDINGYSGEKSSITPSAGAVTLRQTSEEVRESLALYFFVVQDEINTFTSGTYTGSFTITFNGE